MNISHTVNLNMSAFVLPPVLYMAQYDANSRTIVASLWDGLTEFDIPSNAIVMVRFGKPDGTGGLYDHTEAGEAITYSGNVVTAPVATQILTVPGRVRADIEIYQTGATAQAAVKLATFCFTVIVERAAYQDAEIISSDSYNFISAQISAAIAAGEKADAAVQAAETAKEAAEAAASAKTAAQTAASDASSSAALATSYAREAAESELQASHHEDEAQSAATAAESSAKAAAASARNAANASSHSPQISDDGYWRLWDASIGSGAYVKTQYPAQGPAGHTPVKGTDYWTAADKAEMVADVIAALPDGTEVSY